jgi:hypothetical protein
MAEAAEVDAGTVAVVAASGRGGFVGELLNVALAKTLVSTRIPVGLDCGPSINGTVARSDEVVEADNTDTCARLEGAFVSSGKLTLVEVGTTLNKVGDRVGETSVGVEDSAVVNKILGIEVFRAAGGKKIVEIA